MLNEQELSGLYTNQRLLVLELQKRGVDVRILDRKDEWLEADYNGHYEYIMDRDSSLCPYPSTVIAGDKAKTKWLLGNHGISVVPGKSFNCHQMDSALTYAQDLGFPVVVKPVFGSHGDYVYVDLENLIQVKAAIESAVSFIGEKPFIVEEQFDGKEYRVFVTKHGDFAVLHRDPSHVIGDGNHTIRELVAEENAARDPKKTSLCPIQLDEIVDEFLARRGMDLSYVPRINGKVYLRNTSNVAQGGTCEDYTDLVHPSVIERSREVLGIFHGLSYAGIDFMTKNVNALQTPDMYRIIEVNTSPGFKMHMYPHKGQGRNIAEQVVDMMFPETKKR